MKILVIAPTPFFSDRGTHIRILEEALALEKRGHTLTIATYHIGGDIPQAVRGRLDVRRIRRLLFWYKKLESGPDWQKIILDLLLIKKVFFLARTQKPDIIHAHLHEGVAIGWIVQKLLWWRHMVLVADFHGSLTKEMVSHSYLGGGFLKAIFRWVEKVIDNMGDAAVTSSPENTREIQALRYGQAVITVPDGVCVDRYEGNFSREELRKRYGVPLNETVIVYAGALVANKGIRYFLEAIPLALQQCPTTHFLIAGFPYDQIAKIIEDAPWKHRVSLIEPYMSEGRPIPYFTLPDILRTADIAIDPKDSSVAQASGKMLQYMGAGLPIVCFERSNNREYLADGGLYAKQVTSDDLARTLIAAIRLPEETRTAMGNANRERARLFSYDTSAEILEHIYETFSH